MRHALQLAALAIATALPMAAATSAAGPAHAGEATVSDGCVLPGGCAGGAWSTYYAAPIYPFGWAGGYPGYAGYTGYAGYGQYARNNPSPRPLHVAHVAAPAGVEQALPLGDFHPIEPLEIKIK